MEKRVLLAVILSMAVLVAYQAFFPPPKPQSAPSSAAKAGQRSSAPAEAPEAAKTPASPSAPAVVAAVPAAAPVVADDTDREVVVENNAVRAVFTTRGAALKSWKLKKYQNAAHEPLELVPQDVPPASLRPFMLSVEDAQVSATLQQALYRPNATAVQVSGSPASLVFEFADASGLVVRKEFSFAQDQPYIVAFSATVMKGGAAIVPTIEWGAALGSGVASGRMYDPPPQPIFYRDGSVTRVKSSKLQENARLEGTFGFAGVDDHYFLTAAVPPAEAAALRLAYKPLDVPIAGSQPPVTAHFIEWSARYAGAPHQARFFLGPKDFDVLAEVNRDLVRSIDFGMFAWIVVPLLRALKWIDGYIGNYGWSIIALTVLINLVMFPLRHKSVVSMRKMQEIQPEVKAIQDRYAKLKMSDPARQKMNVEMMNLYREKGVNPASGCVPMLLTLPVLFAFYSMLSVAIELRGAPFTLWIRDLSVHDPLYITPVIMGITQLVQTRMTPTTADPAQQKMMMFMPLVMMAMFIKAPAGLVLYWTVSNLWAIGQQWFTNRLIGPPAQRAVRPPAERQLKKAGSGKTEQAAKERE